MRSGYETYKFAYENQKPLMKQQQVQRKEKEQIYLNRIQESEATIEQCYKMIEEQQKNLKKLLQHSPKNDFLRN